jgi:hypothetical protein
LRNKENILPFKAPLKNQNDAYAVRTHPNGGPTFGGGTDLEIKDNTVSNDNSYSYFGVSYQPPSGVNDPYTLLAGTQRFTQSEVEVFYIVYN